MSQGVEPTAATSRARALSGGFLAFVERNAVLLTVLAAIPTALPWGVALLTKPPGVIGLVAADLNIYLDATRSFLDGHGFYLDHQLHGAYDIAYGDVLYPPTAIWLFAPFLVIPPVVWWLVPIGLTSIGLARLRPARWTWPLMAMCLAIPLTFEQYIKGNPVIWVQAFLAIGLAWGWTASWVLLKPSLFPFALAGIRRWRSWLVGFAVLVALTVPFIALVPDYLRVVLDASGGLLYSVRDVPLMLIPLVAWIGRDQAASAPREAT